MHDSLKRIGPLGALAVAALLAASTNPARGVEVEIYAGHTTVGGGAPYTDLVGSFTAPAVTFATDTGYAWHPFGLLDFGALITGCLRVEADGTYTFGLDSDDGSLLFIDSLLVVDNGGAHGPVTVFDSAVLTAGVHHFRIEFFEDFGGPSGVDLILPSGVHYTDCIPDGGSMWLLALAGAGFLAGARRMR